MKNEKFTQALSAAVDALLLAVRNFHKVLQSGTHEQSELLKNYYLFANTLTCHIQEIDSIILSIGNETQLADKQNDTAKIKELGKALEATVTARKLCEEFLSASEQDIEAKKLTLTALRGRLDAFTRMAIILKNTL